MGVQVSFDSLLFKEIGGSGSKELCQDNMKNLLTGKQMFFSELQNSAAVFKNYHILKFGNLIGFLIKKTDNTVLQKENFEIHNWWVWSVFVLLAAGSESDISFAPSRLDFAACEVTIFGKQ